MGKTILVLPDGSELSSGTIDGCAIKSTTVTQCVNDTQELSLGSVCAAMAEVTVITPSGQIPLASGDEVTLYRQEEDRQKLGVFICQKPTRSSANTFRLTAYDRVSLLDKDLTRWLEGLEGWPYSLQQLSQMVCAACGVELTDSPLPNGDFMAEKFTASAITGRQLMKWIGQLTGRFCRADPEGKLEFSWYAPVSLPQIGVTGISEPVITWEDGAVSVTDPRITLGAEEPVQVSWEGASVSAEDGVVQVQVTPRQSVAGYSQNSLKYEDYQVQPVQRVVIRSGAEDVGVCYPEDGLQDANTYLISGNPLAAAQSAQSLAPILEALYQQLSQVSYTPCSVTVPGSFFKTGDVVRVTDRNGVTVTVYVMTLIREGQRQTLRCVGSPRRDSTTVVADQSYHSLSGKVMELRVNMDGIRTSARQQSQRLDTAQQDISAIDQYAYSIDMSVKATQSSLDNTRQQVSQLQMEKDGITAEVARQTESLEGMQEAVTRLQQSADAISLSVQRLQETGTAAVTTSTGYTFGAEGLCIQKSGQEIKNLLDETGMTVSRGDTVMLKADKNGVLATDVSVRNYLVVGDHARFEDHGNGRTACFWI